MKNYFARHYFMSVEPNPYEYTERFLQTFFLVSFMTYSIPADENLVEFHEKLIETFRIEKYQDLITDNMIGSFNNDIPLLILFCYMLVVSNKLLPECLSNLDTLYGIIQDTFNEEVSKEDISDFDLNDANKIVLAELVTLSREYRKNNS